MQRHFKVERNCSAATCGGTVLLHPFTFPAGMCSHVSQWSSCHCVHTSAGCAVFLNKYLWVIHMLKWHIGILTSNFIYAKQFSCLSTSFLYMTDRISNLVRKLTCYGNNNTQLCFLLASVLTVYRKCCSLKDVKLYSM